MVKRGGGLMALALGLAALALPSAAQADERIDRMMAGESWLQGKDLEKAIEKAEKHPLGSEKNPVRVTAPQGQRLYLSRLRCSDGKAPKFYRAGNVGEGPYGNIVDLYVVTCEGGEPRESEIYMDMYHGGYIEERPVPGFTSSLSPPVIDRAPQPVKEPRG